MNTYVYGVLQPADAAGWAGANGVGGSVRALVSGDLAALVSNIADDARPGTREDLEAHRRVLEQAIEIGTVIPMRFGMIMDDDATVCERLLTRHGDELRNLLRTLAGTVQMAVRAFYAEDALLGAALADDEEIQRLNALVEGRPEIETRDERIALGERIAAGIERRRERDAEALVEQLRPFAVDLQVEPPAGERMALSAQLLVRRADRAALDARIGQIGTALQGYLTLLYLGPLSPYSFTALELEPETSEPAVRG